MKNLRAVLAAMAVMIVSLTANAQNQDEDTQPAPRWCSQKGYWVVETNIHTPKDAIVHFYTNSRQLVYSEKVTGKVLNTRRPRVLVKLKRAMEKVINDWETEKITRADGTMNLFGNKKNNG